MKFAAILRRFAKDKSIVLVTFLLSLLVVTGCDPKASSSEQVLRFEKAGFVPSGVDFDEQTPFGKPGPYRVVPGDVLEFQMHVNLRIVSSEIADWLRPSYGHREIEPYLTRVSDTGTITLPIIGDIPVAGKTLAEIEAFVKEAYYPKYVVNPPMIVCKMDEYESEHENVFTVMGLVNKPDAYPYPPDVQYNLMEALAFAGGLNMVADPKFVQVFRQETEGEVVQAVFNVDNKMMARAYNVAIKPGDVIYVNHTLMTRINLFLSDVFDISVGADARYRDF
ncbi:MAG: polysaccharide biosynthesis/export family protein [Sedimentisphaerales bacterium]|nr:polysaccharide biosynthesis/export family protein [Sedimentisphaerales bacterium]